jgi:GNAT superfamily N-acetyltransferase
VSVRPARVEDAEAVDRVHEEASSGTFESLVGRSFDDVFPRDERLRDWTSRLCNKSPDEGILVAEVAGRGETEIVGMAVWRVRHGTGELEDLHVVPAAWGTGVARTLLAAAVAALRGAGVSEPFLWVGEVNGRARRFYEREGWAYDGASRPSVLGPVELRYTLTDERRAVSP